MLIFFGVVITIINAISKAGKNQNQPRHRSDQADVEARRNSSSNNKQSSNSGSFLDQLKKDFQDAYEAEKSKQTPSKRNQGTQQRRNDSAANTRKQEDTKRRLQEQREQRERRNQRSRHSNRREDTANTNEHYQEESRGAKRSSIESRRASNRLDRARRRREADKPVLQNVVSLDTANKKKRKKKGNIAFGKKDMVHAMVYKEILDKPLSMREK